MLGITTTSEMNQKMQKHVNCTWKQKFLRCRGREPQMDWKRVSPPALALRFLLHLKWIHLWGTWGNKMSEHEHSAVTCDGFEPTRVICISIWRSAVESVRTGWRLSRCRMRAWMSKNKYTRSDSIIECLLHLLWSWNKECTEEKRFNTSTF